jgi:hypothetical protein
VNRMPSLFQLARPSGHPLPVEIGWLIQGLDLTEALDGRQRHGGSLSDLEELLLQDLHKRRKGRSMTSQHPHHRSDPMRTVGLTSPQLCNDQVIEGLSFGQGPPGHRQDVLVHPLGQHPHIGGQSQSHVFLSLSPHQSLAQRLSLARTLDLPVLAFDPLTGCRKAGRTTAQETGQLVQGLFGMEDIPLLIGRNPYSPQPICPNCHPELNQARNSQK